MADTQALTDIGEMIKLQQYFEEDVWNQFNTIKTKLEEVLNPTLASWQDPVGTDFKVKYQDRVKTIQEGMKGFIEPLTTYLGSQAQQLTNNYLDTSDI